MIHLLFTGGTISMQRDAAAGGNVPTHGGEELVALVPGLDRVGPYHVENWAKLPACHLGPDRLWALRERVREIAASGRVTGIVVTHGTDVLEETAYLLDRTLDVPVPIAITGAMLTSARLGGWPPQPSATPPWSRRAREPGPRHAGRASRLGVRRPHRRQDAHDRCRGVFRAAYRA